MNRVPDAASRVLLACLRDDDRIDWLSSVDSRVDWTGVVRTARRHGVAPLFFSTLQSRNALDHVPQDARTALRREYYATATRNLKLFEHLKRIGAASHQRGIPVIVLKGPVLATLTYRNPAVRPINDLDLLVHEGDYPKVVRTLEELGFRPARPLPHLGPQDVVHYAHYFSQVRFVDPSGVVVEVHFRLINLGVPSADERAVWERSAPCIALDGLIRTPSMADMLVHLCLHAAQHNFHRLLYLCDVASVLHSHGRTLDWDAFRRAITARRMGTLAYYAFTLCRRLLGAEVPREVLSALKPGYVRGKVFERIWGYSRILALRKSKRARAFEPVVCYLAELDDLGAKSTFVFRTCFPQRSWLASHYRRPVPPIAYPGYLGKYLLGSVFEGTGSAPGHP